ncbi:MAG: single-stranded DNA-binding protein [Deltaproteobacteria bacterium]|nr:single-stranded DNA-binding protein [Deltaproteobacteria bacterium]
MGGPGRRPASSSGLEAIAGQLSEAVSKLDFGEPVSVVYNPLDYARGAHAEYLERFGGRRGVALLLGMNPGPWGMAQTGVPFGEVAAVRDWMQIRAAIGKPDPEHPKRPVQGLECQRSEVSGARLWGWAREQFGDPEAFFARFFVWNYCPLSFMVESGANLTPDKLARAERDALYQPCDRALVEVVDALEPSMVIGIGKFAETRARRVLGDGVPIGTVLHPSPASPIANRGWAPQADKQLRELGVL